MQVAPPYVNQALALLAPLSSPVIMHKAMDSIANPTATCDTLHRQNMGANSDYDHGIEKSDSTDANTNTNADRNNVISDDTPPIYYDAEPSAQPPSYPNSQTTSPTELQKRPASRPKPTNQHSTGASASTIAAVLGSEYTDLDAQRRADRKKKTLRERWNDFKERNLGDYHVSEDRAGAASAAEWNVQGGRLSGGLATPYRR